MRSRCLVLVLGALVLVSADNSFIVPPSQGINVSASVPVTIKWTSDAGSTLVTLAIYQNAAQSGNVGQVNGWDGATLLDNIQDPGGYVWTPASLDGLPTSDGFHFTLSYGSTSINSGALFIVDSNATSSTTSQSASSIDTSTNTFTMSSSSASMSPITSSQPTTSTSTVTSKSAILTKSPSGSDVSSANPSNSPTPASTPNSGTTNSGNSETLKVGLGVGLGIGIPFLLLVGGLGGYLVFRRAARHRQHPASTLHEKPWDSSDEMETRGHFVDPQFELSDQYALHEAPRMLPEAQGDGWRHELPDRRTLNELPNG